jgi:transcriptional coactivator HFI1/ADA1
MKSATGDEGEERLKKEIMQLPRRERKRLKSIQDVRISLTCATFDFNGFFFGREG